MPRPEPHAELAAAQQALAALGDKPPRRRPAYAWDGKTAVLEAIIEKELPAFQVRQRKAGYCPKCDLYIGRGQNLHEARCKEKSSYAGQDTEDAALYEHMRSPAEQGTR